MEEMNSMNRDTLIEKYYEVTTYLKIIIDQMKINEAKIYEKIKLKYSYNDFETTYENNTLAQNRKDRERIEGILNLIEELKQEIERLENKDKEYMNIQNNNLEWQEKYKEALKDECEIADERNQLLIKNQELEKELDTIKSRIHLKVEKAGRTYKNTKSNLKKTMLKLKIGTLKNVLYEEYYSDKKPHKYTLENMINKNKELIKENELKSKVINEMTKEIFGEYKGYEPCPLKEETDCKLLNCEDCIKEYFYKKAQEE